MEALAEYRSVLRDERLAKEAAVASEQLKGEMIRAGAATATAKAEAMTKEGREKGEERVKAVKEEREKGGRR